jgi:tetratricopeptide (TPR) repeat protein
MNSALRSFMVIQVVSTLTICGIVDPPFGQDRGTQGRGDRAADRGIALYQQRDYEAALRALDTALSAGVFRYPLEQLYTIRGNMLNELNRFEEAVSAHRKALEINPQLHEAWVNLGIVYRLMGDYEHAEICYLRALEIAPNYAELHASVGALYISVTVTDTAQFFRAVTRALDGWSTYGIRKISSFRLSPCEYADREQTWPNVTE